MTPRAGTLILMGGGDCADLAPGLSLLIESLPPGRPLLFLPQAWPSELWGDYAERIYECLSRLNLPRSRFVVEENLPGRSADGLQGFGGVLIGGGNTFELLARIRESRFDRTLRALVERGGVVAGNSAGAIVLGKDIRYAHDPNTVGMTQFDGMDLVGGHSLWCHYDPEAHDEEIRLFREATRIPVLALANSSCLRVRAGKWEFVAGSPPRAFSA